MDFKSRIETSDSYKFFIAENESVNKIAPSRHIFEIYILVQKNTKMSFTFNINFFNNLM